MTEAWEKVISPLAKRSAVSGSRSSRRAVWTWLAAAEGSMRSFPWSQASGTREPDAA